MDCIKDRTVRPIAIFPDVHKTYHGKFLQYQVKIRDLAAADPNSYAAVVVRSMDHFTVGRSMMEDYSKLPSTHKSPSLVAAILKEFSISLRASEIFAIWTQGLRQNLVNMIDDTLEDQQNNTSELDRDARVCSATLMLLSDPAKAINFLNESRKKYPNEIFFHRIYSDLFACTKDFDLGLKANDELCKLFPNDPNILYSRAALLRLMIDTRSPDYPNWAHQKMQIEIVKEAYRNYLKVAPKDHREFAESNHILAYLSLKYSNPYTQMSQNNLLEISFHFQNGVKAEMDVLPCFRPFRSKAKDFVTKKLSMEALAHVYKVDDPIYVNVMPGRPKPRTTPTKNTENMEYVDMQNPIDRKIGLCVQHRQMLQNLLLDPTSSILTQSYDNQNINSAFPSHNNSNDDAKDFEEIILNHMTLSKKSEVFTSKVIELTVVEDSLFSKFSGFFEMVVADTTGNVIKLQLDLGTKIPDNNILKELMNTFRFGTVWSLRNPDFHMENDDESTMYLRAGPTNLILTDDSKNSRKCRACFKLLTPGQYCSKCKRAFYCGKECQIEDWKYIKHNLICSEAFNTIYNCE